LGGGPFSTDNIDGLRPAVVGGAGRQRVCPMLGAAIAQTQVRLPATLGYRPPA